MKRGTATMAFSASLMHRLSGFDTGDLGPHARLLYGELIASAAIGLPASSIILAATIIDVVQHEQAGPAGYLDGEALPMPAARPILAGCGGGAICCCITKRQAMA